METVAALEHRIGQAGATLSECVWDAYAFDTFVESVCNHPSLIFLIAMSDEAMAKVLCDEDIPRRGGHMPVPLALMEGHSGELARPQILA